MSKPFITRSAYAEKLRDPRWQKKRLEVLEDAGWCCIKCSDEERTLHVHHKHYFYGKEPWAYDNSYLTVLCEDCHQIETEYLSSMKADFISMACQIGFMAYEFECFCNAFAATILDPEAAIGSDEIEAISQLFRPEMTGIRGIVWDLYVAKGTTPNINELALITEIRNVIAKYQEEASNAAS